MAALIEGLSSERAQRAVAGVVPPWCEGLWTGVYDIPPVSRVAWHLTSIWLLARTSGKLPVGFGFEDAESWFRGEEGGTHETLSGLEDSRRLSEARELLGALELDPDFEDLLPYILEEHGPGSRASVMRDPGAAAARAAKRDGGVFYTPADVADFVVKQIRRGYGAEFVTARALDPACGTGVFLLAMLREAARAGGAGFSGFDYVTSCLHGIDVSTHALDAAAFLLLRSCLDEALARVARPQDAWAAIRRNLVAVDSLVVRGAGEGERVAGPDLFSTPLPCLADLFAGVPAGFQILVGNPPYAALGERVDYTALTARFASLRGVGSGPRLNLFPLFVEMMWQFTEAGRSAAALVTPLSIAYHTGAQYKNCRRAMSRWGGCWRFAFFDRQPHALFGEEVKTRNAILFRFESPDTPARGQPALIETGQLRKWTSRTRASLFEHIGFTRLDSVDITTGIPKLQGDNQANSFLVLRRRHEQLRSLAVRIENCPFADAVTACTAPSVFVGGTAYNFLNVLRPTALLPNETTVVLSESPLHRLDFSGETDAAAAFAVLSSRLVFWLWHVLGDGFHVGSWLFDIVPFARSSFTTEEFEVLAQLGGALWRNLQGHRFASVNRGKHTIGFRPLGCHEERDAIDTMLLSVAKLDPSFAPELQRLVEENAVVDPLDQRRNHVRKYFAEGPRP